MTREIRADYPQLLMFPGSREDWLGPEHPARFIRDLVDSLDLPSRGFRVRATEVGRPLRPEGKMPQLNGRDHLVPPLRILTNKTPSFEPGSGCPPPQTMTDHFKKNFRNTILDRRCPCLSLAHRSLVKATGETGTGSGSG